MKTDTLLDLFRGTNFDMIIMMDIPAREHKQIGQLYLTYEQYTVGNIKGKISFA